LATGSAGGGGRRRLLIGTTLKWWRLDEGPSEGAPEMVGSAPVGDVTALAFEPGGRRLAVAGAGHVRLWELDGRKSRNLVTPNVGAFTEPEAYHQLAFSPDGKLLALGGAPSEPRSGAAGLKERPPSGEAH